MGFIAQPVIVKRYADRRYYNTVTASYLGRGDLAVMVEDEEDFVVYDAKTGADITRAVLNDIINGRAGHG